jgi:putative transcriptional regulator
VVEQRPFKPKVVGSIPTAPTKSPVESVAFASREPQIGAYKALVLAPSWPHISARFTRGDPMPLFRTRLRVLRAEREWSQAKLAAQVGVTRQTINSIEKGRFHPNLRLAFKIARTFGKQIAEVFLYENI